MNKENYMTWMEIAVALVIGIWPTPPDGANRELVARVACGWRS